MITLHQVMYGPMHLLQDGSVDMMRQTGMSPQSFKSKEEAERKVIEIAKFPYDKDKFDIVSTTYEN